MSAVLTESEFLKKWSSLHGNAQTDGIVKGWLKISYRCALILSKLGLTANALTALGVLFATATAISSPSAWSAVFLVLSLSLDGFDGSLAIIKNQASKLGAIFDASADRISEALWAVAFYRLGVPLAFVLFLWLLASIQEYARARIGSAGVKEVGVITPAERPVRASFLFVAILAWQIDFSNGWVTALALALILIQAMSLILVFRFAFKVLK
jgi:archaetidylinositol phosphate synthase